MWSCDVWMMILLLLLQSVLVNRNSISMNTLVFSCTVTADAHPQWRKIVWSDDNSCLAVANRYSFL